MKGVEAEQLLLFPIEQSALQPSPSILFPSSHCSVPTLIPSPHTEVHTVESAFKYHPFEQLTQMFGSKDVHKSQ
jgi:hypothetical protein